MRLEDKKYSFKPVKQLIVARPLGLGKGMSSPLIKDEYCLCHSAKHDILRVSVSSKSPVGFKTKEAINMGDVIHFNLVINKAPKILCQKGFLLDEFRKRMVQEQKLDEMLEKRRVMADKVLNFAIEDSIVEEIITGGLTYHSDFVPSKAPCVDDASNTGSITTEPVKFPEEAKINEEEDRPQKVATLPDHLILDLILPRLPVKPLLRFKLVCKDWRCTISSPEFAKSHLALCGSSHQFALLLSDNLLVKNPNYRIFRKYFKYNDKDVQLRMCGSCNGLVCFHVKTASTVIQFFVLNPATGQRVEILAPGDEGFMKSSLFWFGYISSVDDYKIVAFCHLKNAFWIYSWKTGIWKRIFCSINTYGAGLTSIRIGLRPALINDSLYWPIDVFAGCCNIGTEILELNIVREEYEVKARKNFAYRRGWVKLVNLKGYLALHTTSICLEVWMLRQMGDWNSWEKIYSKIPKFDSLVYYSTTGKMLVSHSSRIKVVDDLSQLPPEDEESRQGEIHYNSFMEYGGVIEDYVETLISPFP